MDAEIEQPPADLVLAELIARADALYVDIQNFRAEYRTEIHKWSETSLMYAANAIGDASGVASHLRAARHNNGETLVREVATTN